MTITPTCATVDLTMSKKLSRHPMVDRELNLIAKYGLTASAYRALEEAQNFKCKICGKHKDNNTHGVLAVDHDHKTDRIRGLLCNKCNQGLGQFDEDQTSLLRAIQYLKGNL